MRRLILAALLLLVASAPAFAVTENISWTNPADTSVTGINVQSAATAAGPFTNVNTAPLAPTATTLTRTIPINVQDCIQIVWVNGLGPSQPLGPVCNTPNSASRGSSLLINFTP